jgi:hypothetical protein
MGQRKEEIKELSPHYNDMIWYGMMGVEPTCWLKNCLQVGEVTEGSPWRKFGSCEYWIVPMMLWNEHLELEPEQIQFTYIIYIII